MEPKQYFVRTASGLIREFGVLDVLLICTAMVWALTYMVTQYAWFYGFNPGADLTLALLIVAIPFAFLLLVYWGIGVIMPRSGSDYVWVSRIFHPSIGFAWSVLYMFVVFATSIVSQCFTYTYLLASAFTTGGFLYNAPSLTDIGNLLSSPLGTFSFSVLLVIIFAIFAILGAKLIKGLLYVSWATAIVGVALMWWLLATTDPGTFAAKWNSVMTGFPSYEALQGSAVAAGWTPPAGGWSAIFGALPLAALFYMGSQYGANVILGEVKGVRKTVPIALFLSVLVGWVFWSMGGYLTLQAVGANWFYAVSYSWAVQPSSYLLPFPPAETLFLSVIAYPNAFLIGLIYFTWLFGSVQALFVYFWAPSRYFFAWSFDRIIPTKFADVGRRYHTPHVAILAITVLAVVELWLYAYAGFANAFALGTFLWVVSYVVPCLAAVVFPYVKKDLMEQAPAFMQKRIAGVPLLTLIGIVASITFGYMGYIAYTNPLITSLTVTGSVMAVVVLVVAFLIYGASVIYNRRRGLDVLMAFKELPPV